MVFGIAGIRDNRNCITLILKYSYCFPLLFAADLRRYSRFGNELLLLPPLFSSIPRIFLDGELWYIVSFSFLPVVLFYFLFNSKL
jgi:hypothetical protein